MTHQNYFFDQGEQAKKISMLDYFVRVYDMKITDYKQPLFEIKQKNNSIYLPPELCILVAIP
jgi:hypothetical protein